MPDTLGNAAARPRRRGPLTLILIVTAWLLCVSGVAPTPVWAAPVTPSNERYGINAAGIMGLDDRGRAAAFDTLRNGGLRLVRFDLSWSRIEPEAPGRDGARRYDWSSSDDIVGDLARSGLRGYPMAGYGAAWTQVTPGTWGSRPRDPKAFAAFVAAAVDRYGQGGLFWREHPELTAQPFQSIELWNEPNADHFWTEQSGAPADYARLYLTARDRIRVRNKKIQVVAAGLVDRGADEFLQGMFAAFPRLKTDLDAAGFHLYLLGPRDGTNRIREIRKTLDRLGAVNAAIELSELGWSLLDAIDVVRGENLAALSRLTADPSLRVTRFIPYAAITTQASPLQWEEWFGLLEQNGSAKGSFRRWAQEIAALGPTSVSKPLATPKKKSSRKKTKRRSTRR